MLFLEKFDQTWLQSRLPGLKAEIDAFDLAQTTRLYSTNGPIADYVESIPLREADRKHSPTLREEDTSPSKETVNCKFFQEALSVLARLSTELRGDLGRARYMLFRPNSDFSACEHAGRYFSNHDQYHLIVEGIAEIVFENCESTLMRQAEIWWVNSRVRHTIRNPSLQRQVHLVFELQPCQTIWF